MKINTDLKPFQYCRKSSEDERQAASIGDQRRELLLLTKRDGLTLVAPPFEEEKSAKAPGRPRFDDMLRRIEAGEANMIVCWDIDRLYRNPVDEGRVRWLLQRAILKEIRTPFRSFFPQDAGLLMGVEGGRAVDHIITLRKGVERSFRGKLANGDRPGIAAPGYLNNRAALKGERNIIPDPERFALVQQGLRLLLSRKHSVRDIHRIARDEWGLRSRKTKRLGGKPYTLSTWYRIFTDPFYCGFFWWKEPGTGIRRLYPGAHVTMVTPEEFDDIQLLLGRNGKPLRQAHRFAFSGLIHCGECGATVTAEVKRQIICSSCRTKFSAPNKSLCPRCATPIDKMIRPKLLTYTYYHCSKRKNPSCTQRSIRAEELDKAIDRILTSLELPPSILAWVKDALSAEVAADDAAHDLVRRGAETALARVKRELEHINAIALSPDTDWQLITPEELRERKLTLLRERQGLESSTKQESSNGPDLAKRTYLFAASARFWFREGSPDQKRSIVQAIGSNLSLRDKILGITLAKPLATIAANLDRPDVSNIVFEPEIHGANATHSIGADVRFPVLLRGLDAIRTYWSTQIDRTPLRDFLQTSPLFDLPEEKKKAA